MNLKIIKQQLDTLYRSLIEYPDNDVIRCPDHHYEGLIRDWNNMAKKLMEHSDEFSMLRAPIPISQESEYFFETKDLWYSESDRKDLNYGLMQAMGIISAMTSSESPVDQSNDLMLGIERITTRFHYFARQMKIRHTGKAPLIIEDEYDVQDSIHSLLRLFYDDVRTEVYTPEYAGSNSRIDFLVYEANTGVEIKFVKKSMSKKRLGEELAIDVARYKTYSYIKTLVCFVYDPEQSISNPASLINDISGEHNGINVIVKIVPQ